MKTVQDRFSLQNKIALVTGASRGIGSETAIELAQAGADIILSARNMDDLEAVKEKILKLGRKAVIIPADLLDSQQIISLGNRALEVFGKIDILINNAGIGELEPFLTTSCDNWKRTIQVNLTAPFLLSQIIGVKMAEQKSGKIINISSQAGVVAFDEHTAYSASKAGLNMLTKSIASELGIYNVQCNAVAPTVILTDLGKKAWGNPEKGDPIKAKIPLKRFGEVYEVADLVLFLSSEASNLITGQTICIDGGYTIV